MNFFSKMLGPRKTFHVCIPRRIFRACPDKSHFIEFLTCFQRMICILFFAIFHRLRRFTRSRFRLSLALSLATILSLTLFTPDMNTRKARAAHVTYGSRASPPISKRPPFHHAQRAPVSCQLLDVAADTSELSLDSPADSSADSSPDSVPLSRSPGNFHVGQCISPPQGSRWATWIDVRRSHLTSTILHPHFRRPFFTATFVTLRDLR